MSPYRSQGCVKGQNICMHGVIYFILINLIMQHVHFIWGGGDIFGSRGIIWINLKEGPQGDATYQRPCGFRQEFFFMFSYSCDPWGRAIFGPRGIIWINVVEVHEVMLHTKYQGSRPCGFRQEECFMFSKYKPILNMWPLGAGPCLAPGVWFEQTR